MLNFGLLKGVTIMAKKLDGAKAQINKASKPKPTEKSGANNANACGKSFKGSR